MPKNPYLTGEKNVNQAMYLCGDFWKIPSRLIINPPRMLRGIFTMGAKAVAVPA